MSAIDARSGTAFLASFIKATPVRDGADVSFVLTLEPSDATALLGTEMPLETRLVVTLDLEELVRLCRRARANKGGRAREGLVEVRRGDR